MTLLEWVWTFFGKVEPKNLGIIFLLLISKVLYSEPTQTFKMAIFAKIVNGFQPLTIFAKKPILDLWLCFENGSVLYDKGVDLNPFVRSAPFLYPLKT